MTTTELVDPVVFADRVCRTVAQDIFFPTGRQKRAIEKAKAYCRGCPRLSHCAEWAQPRAAAGALANCVIAAVHLPGLHKGQAARDAAVVELAEFVADGAGVDVDDEAVA